MDRGQAAVEMIVILGISVLVLMIILASTREELANTGNRFDNTQIMTSLARLADAADFVYSQSIGASMEVYITIPNSVRSLNVTGHCFEFAIALPDGTISQPPPPCTLARLNGTISAAPGSKYVKLTNEGAQVKVN